MTSIRGTKFRHNYRLALAKAEKFVKDPHGWLTLGQPKAFDGLSPVQGEGWLIEGRYGQRPGHDRNVERVKKAPRVGTPMGTDKRRLDPETAQMISESGFPERSRNDDATIQQRVEAHREKREERYGVDRNDGRDPLRQRVAGKGSEPSLKNSRPATDAVPSDDPATAGESGEEVHDGGTAPHAIPESEFENRAAGVTAHLRATHAERENAEMTAWVQRWAPIIEAAKDVSLDHSCGLDGWDEACPECRFAKLMYEEAKR